ncbi:unnamed protein product, partial [marine sediment metagenome]
LTKYPPEGITLKPILWGSAVIELTVFTEKSHGGIL